VVDAARVAPGCQDAARCVAVARGGVWETCQTDSGVAATGGLLRIPNTIGTVDSAPTINSAQPAPLRVPRGSLSANSRPRPKPKAARVPAIIAISGMVRAFSRITLLQLWSWMQPAARRTAKSEGTIS